MHLCKALYRLCEQRLRDSAPMHGLTPSLSFGLPAGPANGASRFSWYDNVLGQSLESVAVGLNDCNRKVSSLAQIDISDDAGLTSVRAADDLAPRSVSELFGWIIFWIHREFPSVA